MAIQYLHNLLGVLSWQESLILWLSLVLVY